MRACVRHEVGGQDARNKNTRDTTFHCLATKGGEKCGLVLADHLYKIDLADSDGSGRYLRQIDASSRIKGFRVNNHRLKPVASGYG